jgi:hypothetical protein
MFDFLLRKWLEKDENGQYLLNTANIDYAVTQGWITQAEGETIKATSRT